jgi:HNH endonuclease
MELDHIIPEGDGGPDTLDNAIPVCFECHAEIHAYNDRHPRGRKYRPEELRQHKREWINLCKRSASVLASLPSKTDVGPVQALIDELEFNKAITAQDDPGLMGAHLDVTQFDRCISEGVLSLLAPDIREAIFQAYISSKRVNSLLSTLGVITPTSTAWQNSMETIRQYLRKAKSDIEAAIAELYRYLAHELDC